MRRTFILIFVCASVIVNAQSDSLSKVNLNGKIQVINERMDKLQKENIKLKSEVRNFQNQLTTANKSIENLITLTNANSSAIAQTADQLGIKINNTEQTANKKIDQVGQILSTNSLLGITVVLLGIIISGVLYWLLSKRQKAHKTEVVQQLNSTKASIEESLVKEFEKQTSLIEKELELLAEKIGDPQVTNAEPDHSLALKLASEINLIERNINLMDKGTKGLKQLERSVGKLKDNLSANGYEMPELLGKQYHQGMKVIVTSSLPDENLEEGSEIITKVLIPQVNFNDIMIQTAQIEVSVGM